MKQTLHDSTNVSRMLRADITEQLDDIVDDLPGAERFIDVCLRLLEDPATLYRSAGDDTRQRLNQAIFTHLFVYNEQVTASSVTSPLAELLAADAGLHTLQATSSGSAAMSALEAALAKLKPNKEAAGNNSGGSAALAMIAVSNLWCGRGESNPHVLSDNGT